MTTARQVIKKAMQKIGALVKGEDPAADEAEDGLQSLNGLLASWANDSLVVYSRTWESFTLSGGTGSYTIGSGGTFNTTRPNNIIDGYIRSGSVDYGLTTIDDEAYNSIAYKSISAIPEFINYNNAYPLGTIRLYPVPSSNYTIFILSEKALTAVADLDTDLSFPTGFERALVYNLALELAPEYGQQPDPSIAAIAKESLGLIRVQAAKVRGMNAEPKDVGIRNIYSGWRY